MTTQDELQTVFDKLSQAWLKIDQWQRFQARKPKILLSAMSLLEDCRSRLARVLVEMGK